MSWIFFAVAAQLSYAASNIMDRFLIEKRLRDPKNLSVLGGTLAAFGVAILVLRGFPRIGAVNIMVLLAAGVSSGVALIPYYKALAREDVSRIVPQFQFIPLIVLVLSYLLLGETLKPSQLWGFALILAAGYLLAVEKFEVSAFRLRRSFRYVLLAGFLFSLPSVFFKYAVVTHDFWDATGYELAGTGLGALFIYLWLDKKQFWEEARGAGAGTWGLILSNEAIYLLGIISMFWATTLTAVPLVSVLGGLQPLFVFLLGLVLSIWFPHVIKEDISRQTIALKIIAIMLVFVGMWFINT